LEIRSRDHHKNCGEFIRFLGYQVIVVIAPEIFKKTQGVEGGHFHFSPKNGNSTPINQSINTLNFTVRTR
jgi:hypothetical protein